MKKISKYLLFGLLVAMGGLFFAELTGDVFNSMAWGDAVLLGMGMYLCVVVVVCTGLILKKLDEKKDK